MIPNSTLNIASNNIGQSDEGSNTDALASWLDRTLQSVLEADPNIPRTITYEVRATDGTYLRGTRHLLNPVAPIPESTAAQSPEPVLRQETSDASETQPPTDAKCSVCLSDFQNAPEAAFISGCETPTWIHSDCLSQHTQYRIADPITNDEINGVGIACPTCDSSRQHSIPVKKLAPQISSPDCLRILQDFHLESQFRIFARDPFSPLLDPVVFKNATCPGCQQQHFVNLRDPEQVIIRCSARITRRITSRIIESAPCDRRFCASCEETPHFDMSCDEAKAMRPAQQLADLNAKLEVYRMAKADDSRFRPCPKCDNLIERPEGCNHIRRSGAHANENIPADASFCDHDICFECLKDWNEAYYFRKIRIFGVDDHDFIHCNDTSNRQRLYNKKIADLKKEIRTLGKEESTTFFQRLTKFFSGNRLSAGN
ncbi:hypothetical protein J7438_01920 [Thalassotalea sp. G20_0]|uniref:Rcat domain-containing protein n=1 Tax=Thalassotalea sp. G20_0 TaxID=2821093 RepID=UPI001ADD4BA1|nr:hypothetical protein [Thalassotalea sp. G20_0]MBO9492851.1 hypothetical protein [Thalassotalea sp. G20_0]